ncbi:uncharacterized protein LTR77_010586 [Saxophila tyrrhenica]|uniref:Prokaryotic-type class I peptide chain release factors domain-containing protein n=1 Tax=Saxophila tyrrhenica TaxID=1690608 RepID=A0AAV9NW56_9PEZI|nr:hypothetical protein LTR77_010586 [Saxophila tyrrhenica]
MLARSWTRSVLRFPPTPITACRPFHTTPTVFAKPLPPRLQIPEIDITESFLKGTGPGGQKINKTSSAVQLKHLPTGLVVKCQGTRSREQNRKDARRLLAERLEEREKGDESRTAIKAERARVKKASKRKKTGRKYRKLAEEREGGVGEGEEGSGGREAVEIAKGVGGGASEDTVQSSAKDK